MKNILFNIVVVSLCFISTGFGSQCDCRLDSLYIENGNLVKEKFGMYSVVNFDSSHTKDIKVSIEKNKDHYTFTHIEFDMTTQKDNIYKVSFKSHYSFDAYIIEYPGKNNYYIEADQPKKFYRKIKIPLSCEMFTKLNNFITDGSKTSWSAFDKEKTCYIIKGTKKQALRDDLIVNALYNYLYNDYFTSLNYVDCPYKTLEADGVLGNNCYKFYIATISLIN